MTGPDSAFRDRLRELTSAAHRSLDHHPVLAPLLRVPLALDDYARALQALHAPQAALEAALRGFAPESALLRPRLPDLEDDLATLARQPFQLAAALPALDADLARLGALYVLEGSNLGGCVIARQLAGSLPEHVPRAFFGRSEGRPRWERFWQFAEARLHEDALEPLAETANRVFAFYRAHFDAVRDGR